MRLLEIRDGLSISVNKIEAIEFLDGFSCKIYMETGTSYESLLPYQSIVHILQQGDEDKTMSKLDKYLSVSTVQSL